MILGAQAIPVGHKSLFCNDLRFLLSREFYTHLGDQKERFAVRRIRETLTPVFDGPAIPDSTSPIFGSGIPFHLKCSREDDNPLDAERQQLESLDKGGEL